MDDRRCTVEQDVARVVERDSTDSAGKDGEEKGDRVDGGGRRG